MWLLLALRGQSPPVVPILAPDVTPSCRWAQIPDQVGMLFGEFISLPLGVCFRLAQINSTLLHRNRMNSDTSSSRILGSQAGQFCLGVQGISLLYFEVPAERE